MKNFNAHDLTLEQVYEVLNQRIDVFNILYDTTLKRADVTIYDKDEINHIEDMAEHTDWYEEVKKSIENNNIAILVENY